MDSQSARYDCFISYASADRSLADDLYQRLRKQNFCLWYDQKRLRPGFDWYRDIEAACEKSRIVLPVLTPRWQKSEWTKYETYGAELILPLLFEGRWEEVATPPLRRHQFHSFVGRGLSGTAWQDLIEAIRAGLARPRPDRAEVLVRVHHRPNPFFVGRINVLNDIHERLFHTPNPALTPGAVEVLAQMGGAGKTALARQYVDKFWRCYQQVFWLNCQADLTAEFADIGAMLFPELKTMSRSAPWVRDAAERARIELEQVGNRPSRLLVLDDAEDEASVLGWVPKTGCCHTLITSKFTGWSAGFDRVPVVWLLDPDPARRFLFQRAGRDLERASEADRKACDEIAKKLGYLPLALEHAGAFIAQQGPGFLFADYARLYSEYQLELLSRRVPGTTAYPESILVSNCVTIDKLPAGARAMLRLASFMADTAIPLKLFVEAADIVAERAQLSPELPGSPPAAASSVPTPNDLQIRDWKDALASYSLIQPGVADDFSVHPLVQAVARHTLDANEQATWQQRAMESWAGLVPMSAERFENWQDWRAALPHAEAMWQRATTNVAVRPPPKLLTEMAAFLFALGRSAEALGPARRDVELRCAGSEADHPDTLTSMELLGQILRQTGATDEAEQILRTVLDKKRTLLGREHPHTLASMSILAGLLTERGNINDARTLYEESLAIGERVMPSDHRDLLHIRNDLAHLLDVACEYAPAEALYRRAFAGFERTLGAEHPETLTCLQNLASAEQSLGRRDEAEAHYWNALDGLSKTLGPDHPVSLKCRGNLAGLLTEWNNDAMDLVQSGDLPRAEAILRRVLEQRQCLLGRHHSDTLQSMRSLAACLRRQERWLEAERLLRRHLWTAGAAFRRNPHTESANIVAMAIQKYRGLPETVGPDRHQLAARLKKAGIEFGAPPSP